MLSSICGTQAKIVSASVAQLVEHLIRNEEVAGSIPAAGSRVGQKFAILIFLPAVVLR